VRIRAAFFCGGVFRYTKVKEVVENFKKNEAILKEALIQAQEATKTAESRYDALRMHAEGKIAEANAEIAQVRESNQTQIVALTMKVKTAEREVASAKRQIEAKDTDNAELSQICDELVRKLERGGESA
jgi:chromosome segregation ATPase